MSEEIKGEELPKEKPLELRDHFAIEMMSALLLANNAHKVKGNEQMLYGSEIENLGFPTYQKEHSKESDLEIERMAIIAYKIADKMRRVRMMVFK